VFAHAVDDDLISREELQSLFIAVKQVLDAPQRVELICPFEQSEPKRLLKRHTKINSLLVMYWTNLQMTSLVFFLQW
jgi:hypothetical protein